MALEGIRLNTDDPSLVSVREAAVVRETDLREDSYMDECLSGRRLYGDDFVMKELEHWFLEEAEGFANLGAKNRLNYRYEYHALNVAHGYQYLPAGPHNRVLSIGGAYGDELYPLRHRISRVTILEPSNSFVIDHGDGPLVEYVKPAVSGIMPFDNESFDLATCFGCLHHIPNVSTVVRELFRCLTPSGYALIREPIVSMGDWRVPRPGLTKHERGIPLQLFRHIVTTAGFIIRKETPCVFPAIPRLGVLLGRYVYNSATVVRLDALLSRLFLSNYLYHSSEWIKKFKPQAVALVLQKPAKPYG